MEYPVEAVLPYEAEEEVMNRNFLPLPPIFSGTNFTSWATEMKAGFHEKNLWELIEKGFEESLDEQAYEALSSAQKEELRILGKNDAGALFSIQIALDYSIMKLIVGIEKSKDAWDFLQRKFDERGSSNDEATEVVNETDHVSVSHTKHVSSEFSESHNSAQPVDEDDDNEEAASPAVLQEDPTISIADEVIVDEEEATHEVARHPLMAEIETESEAAIVAQFYDEELMESLPMRANVFPNNVFDYAGTTSNQPVVEIIEELKAQGTYDEEILSEEEFQKLQKEISFITDLLNGKAAQKEAENENEEDEIIQDFLKHVEKGSMKDASNMKAAKQKEEGSHLAAEDVEICFQDAEEVEDPAKSIFQKWNQEEIKYYYQLMWQQATEHNESAMRAEHSMLEHASLKYKFEAQAVMGTTQLKDEEPWHDSIPAFAEEDERVKLKELEEFQKKKVKIKKQYRRIGEFRVWSKRKKKKPTANKHCILEFNPEFPLGH